MSEHQKQIEHACETHDYHLPDCNWDAVPFEELKQLIVKSGRLMSGVTLDRYAAMVKSVAKGRSLEEDGFHQITD